MKKTGILALLLLAAALCLVGCGKGKTDDTSLQYEAWSTYNTVKVIGQTYKNDTYTRLSPALTIEMMRGEYEGAQLLLTVSRGSGKAELVKGALTDGEGNTIPPEQVQVYCQMYTQIQRNYNGGTVFGAGDRIPDMLLPMETAVAYGENTVSADSNRGFTVEICSDGVKPGVYTGTFTLKVGDKTQDIPVSVTVWDIVAEGRRSEFMSSFLIYREVLAYGEFRNDKEITDRYIEFLLRYHADAYVVRDIYEAAHFTESLTRFRENTRMTGIVIPVDFQMNYQAASGNSQYDETLRYLTELALASTDECCLAEYAYFYPSTYDEADIVPERQEKSREFFSEGGLYFRTLDDAVESLQNNEAYLAKSAALRERIERAIRNIPAVFTNVNYVKEWVAELDDATFCPYISVFNDHAVLRRYQEQAAGVGGHLWAYSCNRTDYPYPTLDIDDVVLGIRVNGWMNSAYGINGYLYYMVNKYGLMFESENANGYLNIYDSPDRGGESNGDGFLLYPGAYYGSADPFATVRLAAYRDGIDDYDMLSIYREKLLALAARYGAAIDTDAFVTDLYARLFCGTIAYENNDAALYEVRRELASRILALDADGGLLTVFDREASTLRIFSTDATLKIDGTVMTGAASGDGYIYTVACGTDARRVTIETSARAVVYGVAAHTVVGTTDATLSQGSRYDAERGVFVIASIDGPLIDLYTPSVTVSSGDLARATRLGFTFGNRSEDDLDFRVKLVTAAGEIELETEYCRAGEAYAVEIILPTDIDMRTVTAVHITFDNVVQEGNDFVLAPDRVFTLSDLWLELQ